MIDFHSHILPSIDDGARNEFETLCLLKEAKTAGFQKIISTSHYALECFEVPEYKRKELIDDFNSKQKDLKIILGSEIFVCYNMINLLEEYKASTIGGTKYILFELPLRQEFLKLKDLINNLQANDYKLIIAHPERYTYIQKNLNILYELRDMGVLFQSNYGSIIGTYGISAKSTLKKMLKDDLVTFLGTDVHKPNSIYVQIPKILNKISKYVSSEKLKDITYNNANTILNGEYL